MFSMDLLKKKSQINDNSEKLKSREERDGQNSALQRGDLRLGHKTSLKHEGSN